MCSEVNRECSCCCSSFVVIIIKFFFFCLEAWKTLLVPFISV